MINRKQTQIKIVLCNKNLYFFQNPNYSDFFDSVQRRKNNKEYKIISFIKLNINRIYPIIFSKSECLQMYLIKGPISWFHFSSGRSFIIWRY